MSALTAPVGAPRASDGLMVVKARPEDLAHVTGTSMDASRERLLNVGLVDGDPIIFTGSRPHAVLNAWLRDLRSNGAPALATRQAYALDLVAFGRWLTERGTAFVDASRQDTSDYCTWRTEGPLDVRLQAASYKRQVAAQLSFYRWLIDDGRIDKLPFRMDNRWVQWSDGSHHEVESTGLAIKAGRPGATIRWLGLDRLKLFLDVGLSGLDERGLPVGRMPSNVERNRVKFRLGSDAGLRNAEGNLLLAIELPPLPSRTARHVEMPLPASICKGGRPRTTWINVEALQEAHAYVHGERGLALEDATWMPRDPLLVLELRRDAVRLANGWRSLQSLRAAERLRLTLPGGGSPLLFLRSGGGPIQNWRHIWCAATERCQRVEPDFPAVSAHVGRHTFATHTLRYLDLMCAEQARLAGSRSELEAALYGDHDALLQLKALLGHASISTTELYTHLNDPSRRFYALAELAELAELEE